MANLVAFIVVLVAAIALAIVVQFGQNAWNRAKDRRRARAGQVPFAGRAEIQGTWPSLVAPQLWAAVRDFRPPWLVRKAPYYLSRRYARGVLTVASGGGRSVLGWEPDSKSRRRGACPWQLDQADIEHIRIRSLFDRSALVSVVMADQSFMRLEIASAKDFRSALARTGITVYEGPSKKADRTATPTPTLPAPSQHRLPGEDQASYARRMAAESKACGDALDAITEESARRRLATVPPLDDRTRTWDDVADFLAMTPAQARQVLKDLTPDDLARLGLRGQDPAHGQSEGEMTRPKVPMSVRLHMAFRGAAGAAAALRRPGRKEPLPSRAADQNVAKAKIRRVVLDGPLRWRSKPVPG